MVKSIGKKSVLIAGMGKSGMAVLQALSSLNVKLTLYDRQPEEKIHEEVRNIAKQNQIECFWGVLPENRVFDYLILSPGISMEEDVVLHMESQGVKVMGELELAFLFSSAEFIAITGTNGKTTTTSLVGEIFKEAGKGTYIAGNIGYPAIEAAVRAAEEDVIITEVSSFQLESIHDFHPHISAILNLTPDHLNRHKTMENYGHVKSRIFENQTSEDYFIINQDCELSFGLTIHCPAKVVPFSRKKELEFGSFLKDNQIVVRGEKSQEIKICRADELQIPGDHNLENALAAAAICYFSGIDPVIIGKVMRSFQSVEHRIEYVNEINGVKYYNDSKGTNTDASIKAIEALKEKIILIAGGYDKGEDFAPFIEKFDNRVKHMFLLGQTAKSIGETAERLGYHHYSCCKDMKECVESASEMALPGDIILLSPACASWGMYENYEQRGKDFKNCVQNVRRNQ